MLLASLIINTLLSKIKKSIKVIFELTTLVAYKLVNIHKLKMLLLKVKI